jgi:ketosteroid isomerase-like protein
MNGIEATCAIILPRMAAHALARIAGTIPILALCACATLDVDRARNDLANAERAFARAALERGVRASFIEFFAPDGLVFEPAPVRVRETWPTRPSSGNPLAQRLEWHPALVDVARANDLGYSTGPFRLTDTTGQRPPLQGTFFSVWQRQADGRWKVWLDIGGQTEVPLEDATFAPRPRVPEGPQAQMHATASTLSDLDRALSGLDAATFAQRLARDARRHEDGRAPVVGAAWTDALARTTHEYVPGEARVSASGDLAASYGRVTRRTPDTTRTGHYCHVWLRNDGAWWLAVEAVVFEG